MIEKKSMLFNNVLYARKKILPKDWARAAVELRKFAWDNGFYPTAPVFYQRGSFLNIDSPETKELDYTIYLPINAPAVVAPESSLGFLEHLHISTGISYRQINSDTPKKSTYALLLTAAEQLGLKLDPCFYHIFLDVYGEGMLDIFASVEKEITDVQSER